MLNKVDVSDVRKWVSGWVKLWYGAYRYDQVLDLCDEVELLRRAVTICHNAAEINHESYEELRADNAKLKEERDNLKHSTWEYMDLNEYLRDKVKGLKSYIDECKNEKSS